MPRIPGGPSGYAGFDPRQIPGCAAWWCPDDLADGTVSSWTDRIGKLALAQGTPAARPVTSTINGVKCIYYDGIDDTLAGPVALEMNTNNILIANVVDITSDPDNFCMSFGKGTNAGGFYYLVASGSGATGASVMYMGTSGPYVSCAGANIVGAGPTFLMGWSDRDVYKVGLRVANTSSYGTPDAPNRLNLTTGTAIYSGRYAAFVSKPFKVGDIVVVRRYDVVTQAELNMLANWFKAKYHLA